MTCWSGSDLFESSESFVAFGGFFVYAHDRCGCRLKPECGNVSVPENSRFVCGRGRIKLCKKAVASKIYGARPKLTAKTESEAQDNKQVSGKIRAADRQRRENADRSKISGRIGSYYGNF